MGSAWTPRKVFSHQLERSPPDQGVVQGMSRRPVRRRSCINRWRAGEDGGCEDAHEAPPLDRTNGRRLLLAGTVSRNPRSTAGRFRQPSASPAPRREVACPRPKAHPGWPSTRLETIMVAGVGGGYRGADLVNVGNTLDAGRWHRNWVGSSMVALTPRPRTRRPPPADRHHCKAVTHGSGLDGVRAQARAAARRERTAHLAGVRHCQMRFAGEVAHYSVRPRRRLLARCVAAAGTKTVSAFSDPRATHSSK